MMYNDNKGGNVKVAVANSFRRKGKEIIRIPQVNSILANPDIENKADLLQNSPMTVMMLSDRGDQSKIDSPKSNNAYQQEGD